MTSIARSSSWTAWVLTLLIPLLLLACMAPGYSASPAYVDEEYYPAGGDYGDSADYYAGAEEEAKDFGLARVESSATIRSRRAFDGKAKAEGNYEKAPPSPPEPTPEPVDASTSVDLPNQPSPEPVEQAASQRQIIYTATMQVSVFDLEHAIGVAEALPERFGGWLHQRADNQLILRIPAEKLEQAMDEIAELGVVDYRLLEALDVTAQYTDLESRIKVLEEMQAQLEALLVQAKDVEQALEIRKALDEVTLELELARGQMRELAKSIAFSTLVLRFIERGPAVAVPTSNDPFTWVDELGVEITEYR